MAHTISSGVHWAVPTSAPISRSKPYCWLFYSRKRGLHDLAILTLGTWYRPHIHTDRGPRPSSCSYPEDGVRLGNHRKTPFGDYSLPRFARRCKVRSPPFISSNHEKCQLSGRLGPTRADLAPYVGGSVRQVSPIHHPSFSAKAPLLRELEVPDHYISL